MSEEYVGLLNQFNNCIGGVGQSAESPKSCGINLASAIYDNFNSNTLDNTLFSANNLNKNEAKVKNLINDIYSQNQKININGDISSSILAVGGTTGKYQLPLTSFQLNNIKRNCITPQYSTLNDNNLNDFMYCVANHAASVYVPPAPAPAPSPSPHVNPVNPHITPSPTPSPTPSDKDRIGYIYESAQDVNNATRNTLVSYCVNQYDDKYNIDKNPKTAVNLDVYNRCKDSLEPYIYPGMYIYSHCARGEGDYDETPITYKDYDAQYHVDKSEWNKCSSEVNVYYQNKIDGFISSYPDPSHLFPPPQPSPVNPPPRPTPVNPPPRPTPQPSPAPQPSPVQPSPAPQPSPVYPPPKPVNPPTKPTVNLACYPTESDMQNVDVNNKAIQNICMYPNAYMGATNQDCINSINQFDNGKYKGYDAFTTYCNSDEFNENCQLNDINSQQCNDFVYCALAKAKGQSSFYSHCDNLH